jgi:hypothetical protein
MSAMPDPTRMTQLALQRSPASLDYVASCLANLDLYGATGAKSLGLVRYNVVSCFVEKVCEYTEFVWKFED